MCHHGRLGASLRRLGDEVICKSCEKRPAEINHPPGMIFVGWGTGWQTCPNCNGSGAEPEPPEVLTMFNPRQMMVLREVWAGRMRPTGLHAGGGYEASTWNNAITEVELLDLIQKLEG